MPHRRCLPVAEIAIFLFICVNATQLCGAQTTSTCVSDAGVSAQTAQSDKGLITIGCPKIWVSDRIFTVLDGLLRDVDSMTLKNLQGLDPNSVTGADLLSIASEFQANIKYDQGAAVANAFKLQKANAQRSADLKQFDTQEKIYEANLQRQQTLNDRKLGLQEREYQLTAAGKSATDPEMVKVKAEEDLVTSQLAGLQTTPPSAIPDQTISSSDTTQATVASTSLTALDQDALQKAFGNVLQNPKLPASMQMDNVIDLLRQRLAREFAVMYDDLSRQGDKYSIYLAQFDVGLIPGRRGKKRHPRIQITFNEGKAVAYDLFPVGAAYNTTTGLAKTSRIGITGAAQTLFGFGLSAAYSRSRNQYRSSLTQTLYVSAFGAGTSQFGWTFGTAPFEDFISSGSRAVYAVLLVPKDTTDLKMSIGTCWLKDGRSNEEDCSEAGAGVRFSLPANNSCQKLAAISYQPYSQRTFPTGTGEKGQTPAQPTSNTVQLVFKQPIDPNMTITVNDKILRRVRDVRGRALYGNADDKAPVLAGNQAEVNALNKSRFGILESDTLEDDTWFQVNSTAVLLNISRQTAGTDTFPEIRVSNPHCAGSDIIDLAMESEALVQIGEWKLNSEQLNQERTAFLPLFTEPYDPGRIKAYVDKVKPVSGANVPSAIRIVSETRRSGRRSPVWLHDQAQVVLELDDAPDHRWVLDCVQDEGTLKCKMPEKKDGSLSDDFVRGVLQSLQLKVWVDEPPYNERPGIWADTDLERVNNHWEEQPYAVSDWSDVHESCSSGSCSRSLWDSWIAKIKVQNLKGKDYCVLGLPTEESLAKRERDLTKEISEQARSSKATLTPLTNERDEVRRLQKAANYSAVVSDTPKEVAQCAKAAVQVTRTDDILSLTIPFDRLPYVLDTITLERLDCTPRSAGCKDLALPNLSNALLPGTLVLTDLTEGGYRLQGEHLKAVTKIRLIRDGAPKDLNALVGVNNVDFFLPSKPSESLTPGVYSVYLLLDQLPVPATREDDQKKIQPLSLSVTKTEKKAETPSKDEQSTKKDKATAEKAKTTDHSNNE